MDVGIKMVQAKKICDTIMPHFLEWRKEIADVVVGWEYDYYHDPDNDKKIKVNHNDAQSLYDKGVRLTRSEMLKEAIEYL